MWENHVVYLCIKNHEFTNSGDINAANLYLTPTNDYNFISLHYIRHIHPTSHSQ